MVAEFDSLSSVFFLSVLCVSVLSVSFNKLTAETEKPQRSHRVLFSKTPSVWLTAREVLLHFTAPNIGE